MINATISGRSKTNSFAYMHIGARHMLSQAEESLEGQLYNLISCLTYSAFTLEAYFNHFGKLRNDNWDKIERKYPKLKKYKMFCKDNGVKYNFDKRPYSTIIELFDFRDCMAHGKSTVDYITAKEVDLDPEHPNRFTTGPEWQEYATPENAHQTIKDVEEIIIELHKAGGFPGNPFSDLGSGFFGVHRY